MKTRLYTSRKALVERQVAVDAAADEEDLTHHLGEQTDERRAPRCGRGWPATVTTALYSAIQQAHTVTVPSQRQERHVGANASRPTTKAPITTHRRHTADSDGATPAATSPPAARR